MASPADPNRATNDLLRRVPPTALRPNRPFWGVFLSVTASSTRSWTRFPPTIFTSPRTRRCTPASSNSIAKTRPSIRFGSQLPQGSWTARSSGRSGLPFGTGTDRRQRGQCQIIPPSSATSRCNAPSSARVPTSSATALTSRAVWMPCWTSPNRPSFPSRNVPPARSSKAPRNWSTAFLRN